VNLWLQRRREQEGVVESIGLDDADYELLEQNKVARSVLEKEIQELHERNVSQLKKLTHSMQSCINSVYLPS